MFKETRKMMELFEDVGYRKVLIIGIDVSKNKFTAAAVNGMYEDNVHWGHVHGVHWGQVPLCIRIGTELHMCIGDRYHCAFE